MAAPGTPFRKPQLLSKFHFFSLPTKPLNIFQTLFNMEKL